MPEDLRKAFLKLITNAFMHFLIQANLRRGRKALRIAIRNCYAPVGNVLFMVRNAIAFIREDLLRSAREPSQLASEFKP